MRLFIMLLCLFVQLRTFSQEAELLSSANSGLVDNDLLSVSVDRNGIKWIGTSKYGLVKLDKGQFEVFNSDNSVVEGNYISPIYSDSKGRVWVSFSNPKYGLAYFDGKVWTVFTEKELGENRLSVISMDEDTNGDIYAGGVEGVFRFDGKSWSRIELPDEGCAVRCIDIQDKNNMAIGCNSALFVMHHGKWTTFTKENSELRLPVVRAVKFLTDGSLIVGYGGGFGDGGFSIIKNSIWTHYNKTNSSVPDHMVRDIEIDASGTIWMATNNGVVKMVGSKITPILFREGMFQNTILDISIENDVKWIATNFGLIKMK